METGLVGHHGAPAGKARKAGHAPAVDPPLEGVKTVSAKLKRLQHVRMRRNWITYGEKVTCRLNSISSAGPQNTICSTLPMREMCVTYWCQPVDFQHNGASLL